MLSTVATTSPFSSDAMQRAVPLLPTGSGKSKKPFGPSLSLSLQLDGNEKGNWETPFFFSPCDGAPEELLGLWRTKTDLFFPPPALNDSPNLKWASIPSPSSKIRYMLRGILARLFFFFPPSSPS